MKKKIVSGLLAMTIAASLITGCGAAVDVANDFHNTRPTQNIDTPVDVPAVVETESSQNKYCGTSDVCTEEALYDNGGYYVTADCGPYIEPYYQGGESYAQINENKFLSVKENPLSTFSADVDTASYSNVRRMILDGYEPEWIDKDAVRIEEMINYFSYDYKTPKANEPFSVNSSIAKCPWNNESYLMMVGLSTESIDFSEAPASNLVFLIDVSGSMYDSNKLPLLQKSFTMLTDNLSEKDRVSIVTYAGDDRVVLRGARGDEKDTIKDAINSLEAGGSTNGSAGIVTAYELAERYFIEGGNNRVILATDGDLNVGITSNGGLEDLISSEKNSGVFLSVLGFGAGNIKDDKMELLADKGNGNYSYIDSVKEAKKVLVEEMGATLVTVAKDVKFQLEFNSDVVDEYRQIGYENRQMAAEDFDDDTKDAGEIGAGHSVTVLYEIKLAGSDAKTQKTQNWTTLHIRYKEPSEDVSTELLYNIGSNEYSDELDRNMSFAAAVAEFGMILRDSEFKGNSTCDSVMKLVSNSGFRGDEYKEEFMEIVDIYAGMLH